MSEQALGYVKIYRCIIDSKLWSCSDATLRLALFLLLSANHKPRYYNRILIERGQCIRSLTQISDACHLSRKAVRYGLRVLETENFISTDRPFGAQQGHRITICKYETWQSENEYKGTAGAQQGHRG